MLDIIIKTFEELTINELYEILQLRSEVFVVEQDCVYLDIDGKDKNALHIIGSNNGIIVAYARAFDQGNYFKEASIGRVVVKKPFRNFSYGYDIMNASIQAVQEKYNQKTIKVSAQTYLKSFYNNLGFVEDGKEYLEDGIPHIAMIKTDD